MENKLIDTHAHLLKKSYPNSNYDLDQIIQESLSKLEYVANISWNADSSAEVVELAKKYPTLIPVVGIHPTNANDEDLKTALDKIETLLQTNKNIVAIGEIGIDLYYREVPLAKQQIAFRAQLNLARKYNLPVVIHVREAYQEAYEVLKDYADLKILLHSWNSTTEDLKQFLSLSNNVYFGINGIVTFKSAKLLNESMFHIPLARLVIETDCPWLTPVPKRGKINYPTYVEHVFKYLASKLEMDEKLLAQMLNKNSKEFFELEHES